MKKILFILILFATGILNSNSQVTKTIYIDFGPNDGTNGKTTTSPDVNGNYWNNAINPLITADSVNLIDKNNQATGFYLKVTGLMSTNGIQNGGLLSPDTALLHDLGIPTATEDYFFTTTSGSITLNGFNTQKGYVFKLFGTRNNSGTRITTYTLQGNNNFIGNLTTSGTNLGGSGNNGNTSTILSTDTIIPDANGKIKITIAVSSGGFAYLNLIKFMEVNPPVPVTTDTSNTVLIDFGTNDGTNGQITSSPDINDNYWNNATDTSVAAAQVNLVNTKNNSTGFNLKITGAMSTNGILNGGLLSPSASLLNDIAIPSATEDYFYTSTSGSITINGLNVKKGYLFSLFATRTDTETRVTTYNLLGANQFSGTLQTSGLNLGGIGYNGNNKTILVSDTIMPDTNGVIKITITKKKGSFAYLGILKFKEVIAKSIIIKPVCPTKERYLIAAMGSSVAYGYGATNNLGYIYQYTQLLKQRADSGIGKSWQIKNISVSGNTTIDVLNRWNKDLLPLCNKYVIYALSLGNEGIISGGQKIFNQFRDNLQLLISKARAVGIEPLITNCYTRADYDSTAYNFVKQINLLIHSWDVTSINLLGAIDNGVGHWATGYQYDALHPNTLGHTELSYSIVPSLFDAIDSGKVQPVLINGTSLNLGSGFNKRLEFIPEKTLHSFTVSFDLKTSATGEISIINTQSGNSNLSINSSGNLIYSSAYSSGIKGKTLINNGQWHKITLTHYYAWGKSLLYIDSTFQDSISEKMKMNKFSLNGILNTPTYFKNLLFYRSAMNALEIKKMAAGQLLKSSLEICSPLDAQEITGTDTLINLAQSLNKAVFVNNSLTEIHKVNNISKINIIYPNPATDKVIIEIPDKQNSILSIYNSIGELIIHNQLTNEKNVIDINALSKGIYFIKISNTKRTEQSKLIKN